MVLPNQRQIVTAICNYAKRSLLSSSSSPAAQTAAANNCTLATNSNHNNQQKDLINYRTSLNHCDALIQYQHARQFSIQGFATPRWIFSSVCTNARGGARNSAGAGATDRQEGFQDNKDGQKEEKERPRFENDDMYREFLFMRNVNALIEGITWIGALVMVGLNLPTKYCGNRRLSSSNEADIHKSTPRPLNQGCPGCRICRTLFAQMKEWGHTYIWGQYFGYSLRHALPRVVAVSPIVNTNESSQEVDLTLPLSIQPQFPHQDQYEAIQRQLGEELPGPSTSRDQGILPPERSSSPAASETSVSTAPSSRAEIEEFWEQYNTLGVNYADVLVNMVAVEEMKQNPRRSFKYLKSCDGRLAAALYNLGVAYEKGCAPLTKSDLREAFRHYEMAARMGHKYAIYNLALFYLYGKGPVKQDILAGHNLMTRAAYLGVKRAQHAINQMEEHIHGRRNPGLRRHSSSPNLSYDSHPKATPASNVLKKGDHASPSRPLVRTARIHLDSVGSSHSESDPEHHQYDPFIEMVLHMASSHYTNPSAHSHASFAS